MTSTKIFKTFSGSYVYILTRTLRSTVGKQVAPVVCDGFLIDEDDEYFFLGVDLDEITDAIRKDDVVRMFLPIDELNSILEANTNKPKIGDMN